MKKLQHVGQWVLPFVAVLSATQPAWAVRDQLSASNVDPTTIQAAPPACSDICGKLVRKLDPKDKSYDAWGNGSSDPTQLNKTEFDTYAKWGPSGPWNNTDGDTNPKQWCANHGYPIDDTVAPTATPDPSSEKSKTCNIPLMTGDISCADANDRALQCMFHGSQLFAQCLAYEAAESVQPLEDAVLALDIAATTTCTTACAVAETGIGAAMEISCMAVGGAATVLEFINNIEAQRSPTAKAVNGALEAVAALGIGVGMGASMATQSVSLGSTSSLEIATKTAEKTAEKVGEEGTKESTKSTSQQTSQRVGSCVAAAFFAVMTGVRIGSMVAQSGVKSGACETVQSLWSTAAPAAGTGGSGGGGNGSGFTYNPSTGTSTGPNGSGGGNGSTVVTEAEDVIGTDQGGKGPSYEGATDGKVLVDSGMNKAAKDLAKDFLKSGGAARALKDGAGATLGNALGGMGDVGAAMAKLGQTAQDNARSVPGLQGFNALYSSRGGGSSGGGGGKSDNPFANLFGAGGKDAAGGRGPSSETFGKAGSPSDIWHTGTTQNIFQIVSGKLEQVSSRVASKR